MYFDPVVTKLPLIFVLWSLCAYLLHRAAHVVHPSNFLFRIHMEHHRIAYLDGKSSGFRWPKPAYFLLWFGSPSASADVWITLVAPALVIAAIWPGEGIYLVLLVYLYEVFGSETVLDHNVALRGKVTRVFAWGQYHLSHHQHVRTNYGLYITLWDTVFWTRAAARERGACQRFRAITSDAGLTL